MVPTCPSPGPLCALNTIIADSIDYVATELENKTGGDSSKLGAAVQELIKDIMEKHDAVIFNGDGYSEEWQVEAAKRGLPNLKTSVEALPVLTSPEVVSIFEKYGVLSGRELESRQEVYLEQYSQLVLTEALLTAKIAKTIIFPSAVRYQNELAATCANMKAAGIEPFPTALNDVTEKLRGLQKATTELEEAIEKNGAETALEDAANKCKNLLPAMLKVRSFADELECVVADDLWDAAQLPGNALHQIAFKGTRLT